MNKQLWLWLFFSSSLLLPPRMATAQIIKESHRDVPGFDSTKGAELMAQRLQELHQLQQLQAQVEELLNNPEILNQLKKQYSDPKLQARLEQMLKGVQGRSREELLQQAAMLRSLHKPHNFLSPPVGDRGSLHGPGPDALPPLPSVPDSLNPPMSPPPQAETQPSLFKRMQKESAKWLMDNLDDVGGNAMEALKQMDAGAEGSPLVELLRSMRQADFADMNFNENSSFPIRRMESLVNSLSNMSDSLQPQGGIWDEMRSRFRDASVPALPHFDGPSVSLPASPSVDGDAGAPALLSVMMLGVIVVLLCRLGRSMKSPIGDDAKWRLGPWPMPLSSVSTRQDLIRVFEHLVLFCFGPTAAVCHHRALAARLAEQDSGNPGRRQAAEMLAWLYEQARYAPAEDALSSEQLSDARQALRLLAGVTAL